MNELQIIEHQNQRVLTTQQLAECYGTTSKIISYNFNYNRDRYVEGKHFIKLEGEEKIEFINRLKIQDSLKNAKIIYLWTERGAFLHAKSLNSDKAWGVYDSLVEHYFQSREANTLQLPNQQGFIDLGKMTKLMTSMENTIRLTTEVIKCTLPYLELCNKYYDEAEQKNKTTTKEKIKFAIKNISEELNISEQETYARVYGYMEKELNIPIRDMHKSKQWETDCTSVLQYICDYAEEEVKQTFLNYLLLLKSRLYERKYRGKHGIGKPLKREDELKYITQQDNGNENISQKSNNDDPLRENIEKVAVLLKDTSTNHVHTLKSIYKVMEENNDINWQGFKRTYKLRHKIRSKNTTIIKLDVIRESTKLTKMFNEAVCCILEGK